MKHLSFLFVLFLVSTGSGASPVQVDAKKYFGQSKGCFLLYNMKTKRIEQTVEEENCKERYVACSTFKVPLAVMAFDAGVLENETTVLKWDGKKQSRPELNKDHDARSWMKDSVVWFSQRISAQLGEQKLKKYLADFGYGNQDLSDGITTAWLVHLGEKKGGLKVSAYEQLDFMKRLWSDELPVSKKAMQLTRNITSLKPSPKGYQVNGKTGSNYFEGEPKRRLGWFVVHIQKGDQQYVAVSNFVEPKASAEKAYGGQKARRTTERILRDLDLW